MDKAEFDKKICNLIAYAGDSKSSSIEAMEAGRAGDLEKAGELLRKSDESLTHSHKIQSEIIFIEAKGEGIEQTTLLMHAISLFTAAEVANLFAEQYVELCKEVIDLRREGLRHDI
jgi:cellobiose-specific phosphotransferase system component IIA